ncbi:non-canonical purine NTP pyrophosphatase [Salipaludibacillus sp. HK11]|uniref:non-canonical purine NTP pyrophosphatase n=1 Tax=Salipaludibacillus sp. HK11 TaxID=3394320 RepID=UPI0039FB918F
MQLVVATWNEQKFKLIQNELKNLEIPIFCLAHDIQDIEETENTFIGNARLKVNAAREKYKKELILGEDSGLCIDALSGFPGVHTARFRDGDDNDRAAELLNMLKGIPLSKRQAQFQCSIALSFPEEQTISCSGTMTGWIAEEPIQRSNGYGDIFLLSNGRPLSAQNHSTNQLINHRSQALFQAKLEIIEWLKRGRATK